MASTALRLVNKVFSRLGIDTPTSLLAQGDPNADQILALAIEEGEELAKFAGWSALTVEGATISLVAGQQSYALPVDFDRLVEGTSWDRTNKWRTFGPDTPQTARWRRESISGNIGPRISLRQSGPNLLVFPVPTASGGLIAFDYMSTQWAVSATGIPQSQILADTDTILLPENVYIAGLKWRWMAAKSMECTALEMAYERARALAIAQDKGGGRPLGLSSSRLDDGNADDVVAASGVTVVLGTSGGSFIGVD